MFFSSVHWEIRERGSELYQRVGEENPHCHRSTCSTAGVFGTFKLFPSPFYLYLSFLSLYFSFIFHFLFSLLNHSPWSLWSSNVSYVVVKLFLFLCNILLFSEVFNSLSPSAGVWPGRVLPPPGSRRGPRQRGSGHQNGHSSLHHQSAGTHQGSSGRYRKEKLYSVSF